MATVVGGSCRIWVTMERKILNSHSDTSTLKKLGIFSRVGTIVEKNTETSWSSARH